MTAGIVALSRPQFLALLNDDLDGSGPCSVSDSLPWSALRATGIVPGARILMEAAEGDGARLTGSGYLNRKLVEALMDGAPWPGDERDTVRAICKVFNEHDFAPAGYLHALLRLSRLVRLSKGYLKLTRDGRQYLAEEAAGRLQARLFRTTFTRYNLGYLDRYGPDVFGRQIKLILFLIGRFCTDWHPADELMRSVTLPSNETPDDDDTWGFRSPASHAAFTLRVLRYLCWFGMMEEAPRPRGAWREPGRFRKTPLYDQMLTFTLDWLLEADRPEGMLPS